MYEKQRETEEAAARLLGTSADNVAFLSNSSEALNLLANSIDWQEGDEVLICDLEFPVERCRMASSCGDGCSGDRDSHYRRRDAAGGLDHTTVAADSNRFRQPSELQDRNPGAVPQFARR